MGGGQWEKVLRRGGPDHKIECVDRGWLPVHTPEWPKGVQAVNLTGTYDRNLDAKGRLSLPAVLRKQLPDRVYVLPAPEQDVDALYVFTEDTFEAWLDSVFESQGGYDPTKREHIQVRRMLNGAATTLEIDSAARISLPASAPTSTARSRLPATATASKFGTAARGRSRSRPRTTSWRASSPTKAKGWTSWRTRTERGR